METIDFNKVIADLLQKNVGKILGGVQKFGSDKYRELLVKTKIAYKNYLTFSLNKHSKVKTILYREVPVDLLEFYVHSNLRYRSKEISVENVEDIFKISNSIIVTGTAGAGKSTFMKYLFINTIKNKNHIPIHVELRNLNNSNISLSDYIYESLTIGGFDLDKEYFFSSLDSGKFIFYFDGYDEVDYARKDEVTREIIKIRDKYNKNNFIIFSRPDHSFISWGDFIEMKLLPLSKDKATELVIKLDYDTEIKEKFLSELNLKLYEQHKSFVSNPLLLTIMIMTFNQFAEIPNKMHLFYEQAFDTLYSKHDATKTGYKRVMSSNLAKDEFQKILSCFSFLSYINGDFNFNSSKIDQYFSQSKRLTGIEFNNELYLYDLIKSVCLLLQDGFLYTFSHRTFQEYFAARYLFTLKDEILAQILPKVTQNSSTDKVLDILFDLDKERIEELLLIPVLTELKEKLKYNEEEKLKCYNSYIQLLFHQFSVHATLITVPEEDEEFAVSLTCRSKEDPLYELVNLYEKVVRFVDKKYEKVEIQTNKTQILSEQEIINKYFINNSKEGFISERSDYDISVLQNEKIFNDIFCESSLQAKALYKAMVCLNIIREKVGKRQEDIVGILFK